MIGPRMALMALLMHAVMRSSVVLAAGGETSESATINPATITPATPESTFTVAGIQAHSGEDDPRILYILPWQLPTLPLRPGTTFNTELPALMAPAGSQTLENHRRFRQTLDPLVMD